MLTAHTATKTAIAMGVLRALMAAAGGWAVAKGYLDADTADQLTGAATILGAAIWSAVSKTGAEIPPPIAAEIAIEAATPPAASAAPGAAK